MPSSKSIGESLALLRDGISLFLHQHMKDLPKESGLRLKRKIVLKCLQELNAM
jgi:hypothetical protein